MKPRENADNDLAADADIHPDRAAWIEDAFDGLDMAAVLFDETGRLVASNRRYDRIFLPEDAPPRIGETIGALARRIGATGRFALFPGLTAEEVAAATETAVRSFTRDFELPMTDGRTLIGASNPTRRGGYLVTFRDAQAEGLRAHQTIDLLDSAFDSAAMGMILWDDALRIQKVNEAWRNMIGDVIVGSSARDHLCAAALRLGVTPDPAAARRLADGMIASAHAEATQGDYQLADGRTLQVAAFPTHSGGVLGTALDVTEARTAEAQARALLEDAIEGLGEGVALYDRDLRLILNNSAFRSLVFEDQPLGVVGAPLRDEVRKVLEAGLIPTPPGETTNGMADWIVSLVKKGATDMEIAKVGDRVLEVSSFATPLGGYLVSMRDITARKRGEEATREADSVVRMIVDANPTAFLMCRLSDGKIIYMSPSVRERFGDAETTLNFFADAADRGPYLEALSLTGALDDYPVRMKTTEGKIVEGLMSVRTVDYKGEKAIVSSLHDITDHLAMQAELERQREAAHQNEKLSALGELLAGVSHELNNPLSVVVGYTLMLQDAVTDPTLKRRIDEISVAAERCKRIVKTFLAMARERPADISMISINETVDLAVEVAGHGLRAAGMKIELSIDPELPDIAADTDQIAQVFCNLIINAEQALKDCGADGRLMISTEHDLARREVRIVFADNGPGIDPAIRSRIFEPFFTTKGVGDGTGVGLAFCHRVVTAHGGGIAAVLPKDGAAGARLVVTLPLDGGRDPEAET